jgi:chemotaxis signal transduction protein
MAAELQCLLCQVDASYLAVPISYVVEVTRPLPITRLPHAPSWVAGVSVLRGITTPVVDARKLLIDDAAAYSDERGSLSAKPKDTARPRSILPPSPRWVALHVDDRRVALAVDAVLREHTLSPEANRAVPPLLAASRAISALGTLEGKLLMVLEGAQLLASDALASMRGHELRR